MVNDISKRHRSKRKRSFIKLILIIVAAACVIAGIFAFFRYRQFSGYSVEKTLDISNSRENTYIVPYNGGYLKFSSDGVICFSEGGIKWSEYYSVTQPIFDVCGEYAAVADMMQRTVYIFDKSGCVNKFNTANDIIDIAVSGSGITALTLNEGNKNYLEVRDKNGSEIMTQKSIFSSSGFLMDADISEDGLKLGAIFVKVDKGTLRSRTLFYDLSGNGQDSDIIAGTFEREDSMILTDIRFMSGGRICTVGDAGFSIYAFSDMPELICENIETDREIQALFFSDEYIGMIVTENGSETKYKIKVFDAAGNLKLDQGTDFSFVSASFAGRNVVMYSASDCMIYSFAGVQKFYYSFDRSIESLVSSDGRHFVYGNNTDTEFITLK